MEHQANNTQNSDISYLNNFSIEEMNKYLNSGIKNIIKKISDIKDFDSFFLIHFDSFFFILLPSVALGPFVSILDSILSHDSTSEPFSIWSFFMIPIIGFFLACFIQITSYIFKSRKIKKIISELSFLKLELSNIMKMMMKYYQYQKISKHITEKEYLQKIETLHRLLEKNENKTWNIHNLKFLKEEYEKIATDFKLVISSQLSDQEKNNLQRKIELVENLIDSSNSNIVEKELNFIKES